MAQALEKVKQDLGPDAVILHTRSFARGGLLGIRPRRVVEITASRNPSVLPMTERRVMVGGHGGGRVGGTGPGDMGGRPDTAPQAEGAAVNRPAPWAAAPGPVNDVLGFAADLRSEVGELRAMIRELLGRSPSSGGPPVPAPVAPEQLRDYYTRLIQNAVAEEIAREVMAKARDRLAELKARVRVMPKGDLGSPFTPRLATDPSSQHDSDPAVRWEKALDRLVPAVLVETIERMLPPAQPVRLNADGTTRYVALVGPTGVGKTTTAAKLAAHFKLREGRRVGLITLDTYRIAAVDQLRAYADIMEVPLEIVMTPEAMAAAVRRFGDLDVVLIDTTGRSHKDAERLEDLKAFLDVVRCTAASGPGDEPRSSASLQGGGSDTGGSHTVGAGPLEVHLLLSCTCHAEQLIEVARRFAVLGIDRVVFTKLDEAVGLGVIINVIQRLNWRTSYLTTGQNVPDDIEVGHRRRLAEMVLRGIPAGKADPAEAHGPLNDTAQVTTVGDRIGGQDGQSG